MGHGFGYDHSFDDQPTSHDAADDSRPGAYGDAQDIMSAMLVNTFNNHQGVAAGDLVRRPRAPERLRRHEPSVELRGREGGERRRDLAREPSDGGDERADVGAGGGELRRPVALDLAAAPEAERIHARGAHHVAGDRVRAVRGPRRGAPVELRLREAVKRGADLVEDPAELARIGLDLRVHARGHRMRPARRGSTSVISGNTMRRSRPANSAVR